MPLIKQLDPHVADLIAAGEVVERPASVVKELVENSIDAGASAVTVEIERGGMSLIRVTDNGCGIPTDQAATAFLRHATSKISREQDLASIQTLGFRGEALAAISAVSRIDLLTKTPGSHFGTSLTLEGGRVTDQDEAGCPDGTSMTVRDLFFNTPARLKFIKKDSAEGSAVFSVVQRLALSHPELSVRFLREGKQELQTPGDGKLKSAVYSVLGRDIALGMIEAGEANEKISVSGFVSLPACCRGSRGNQFFFLNGRSIKNFTIVTALEDAYQNQKMVGRFPGCVLHLTVPSDFVDVNVHPTKTEVKFENDHQLYSAVYHTVLTALNGAHTLPQAVFSRPSAAEKAVSPEQGSPFLEDSLPFHPHEAQIGTSFGFAASAKSAPVFSAASASSAEPASASRFRRVTPLSPEQQEAELLPLGLSSSRAAETADFSSSLTPPSSAVFPPSPDTAQAPEHEPDPQLISLQDPAQESSPWQIRGELFQTYVMVEQEDKIILIDKHAAHERINFDRLKAAGYQPMIQQLLTPVTFTPTPEERDILLEQGDLLNRFGFELEEFGASALAVRSAPDYLDPDQIESALQELAHRIQISGSADPASARDELLHTMACRAAIKGGQKNGACELEEVAKAVMSGEVRYCPHGRPVAIELTQHQLEKMFKRT